MASSWRPSITDNGNPGTSDAYPFEGGELLDYALNSNEKLPIRYEFIKDLNNETTSLILSLIHI